MTDCSAMPPVHGKVVKPFFCARQRQGCLETYKLVASQQELLLPRTVRKKLLQPTSSLIYLKSFLVSLQSESPHFLLPLLVPGRELLARSLRQAVLPSRTLPVSPSCTSLPPYNELRRGSLYKRYGHAAIEGTNLWARPSPSTSLSGLQWV